LQDSVLIDIDIVILPSIEVIDEKCFVGCKIAYFIDISIKIELLTNSIWSIVWTGIH
jgi:hypothetical protein